MIKKTLILMERSPMSMRSRSDIVSKITGSYSDHDDLNLITPYLDDPNSGRTLTLTFKSFFYQVTGSKTNIFRRGKDFRPDRGLTLI